MPSQGIDRIVLQALNEDASRNDITTKALIAPNAVAGGHIIFKENGVLCGLEFVRRVFRRLDKTMKIYSPFKDGDYIRRGTKVVFLKGKTRAILTGERTALNFLGYLSGIATNTYRFVQKIRPIKAQILDTRKTTPTLRRLERYAVRCGGGVNHRFGLDEMIFIKDNHRPRGASANSFPQPQMIRDLKKKLKKPIEVEADNLRQFRQALAASPDVILLDNMSIRQMRKACLLAQKITPSQRPLLEASGGITLRNVRAVALTGVDRISIGALTHCHRAIDVALEIGS